MPNPSQPVARGAHNKIRSYRDLVVWQKSMDLAVSVCRTTKQFPNAELYGLCSQLRRAAVSIPANIAEGCGRWHRGNYVQHLLVANGSLKELETHLLLSLRLSYLTNPQATSLLRPASEIGRMLATLIQTLQRKPG